MALYITALLQQQGAEETGVSNCDARPIEWGGGGKKRKEK